MNHVQFLRLCIGIVCWVETAYGTVSFQGESFNSLIYSSSQSYGIDKGQGVDSEGEGSYSGAAKRCRRDGNIAHQETSYLAQNPPTEHQCILKSALLTSQRRPPTSSLTSHHHAIQTLDTPPCKPPESAPGCKSQQAEIVNGMLNYRLPSYQQVCNSNLQLISNETTLAMIQIASRMLFEYFESEHFDPFLSDNFRSNAKLFEECVKSTRVDKRKVLVLLLYELGCTEVSEEIMGSRSALYLGFCYHADEERIGRKYYSTISKFTEIVINCGCNYGRRFYDINKHLKTYAGLWSGILQAARMVGIRKLTLSFHSYCFGVVLAETKDDDLLDVAYGDLVHFHDIIPIFMKTTSVSRIRIDEAFIKSDEDVELLERYMESIYHATYSSSEAAGSYNRVVIVRSLSETLAIQFIASVSRCNFYVDYLEGKAKVVEMLLRYRRFRQVNLRQISLKGHTINPNRELLLNVIDNHTGTVSFRVALNTYKTIQQIVYPWSYPQTFTRHCIIAYDIYNRRKNRKLLIVKEAISHIDVCLYRDDTSNIQTTLKLHDSTFGVRCKSSFCDFFHLSFDKVEILEELIDKTTLSSLLDQPPESVLLNSIKELHIVNEDTKTNKRSFRSPRRLVHDFISTFKAKARSVEVYWDGVSIPDLLLSQHFTPSPYAAESLSRLQETKSQ